MVFDPLCTAFFSAEDESDKAESVLSKDGSDSPHNTYTFLHVTSRIYTAILSANERSNAEALRGTSGGGAPPIVNCTAILSLDEILKAVA
jgi:hypothetical protein